MSTKLLEAVIEANMITAIAALAIAGVGVNGFWNPALTGNIKNSDAAPAGNIFVAVSPRGYGSYSNKTCRFIATVKVSLLPCNDPTATTLPTLFKSVVDLCMAWKEDAAVVRTALSTTGEFLCDGATITPGGQIGFQQEAWTASLQLEIAGTEV